MERQPSILPDLVPPASVKWKSTGSYCFSCSISTETALNTNSVFSLRLLSINREALLTYVSLG